MILRLAPLAFVLALGCSSNPSYTVGGHTLTVQDSGYLTTTGYYCQAAEAGQLRLVLVDYSPICMANETIDADGGARNPQLEHNELEMIFVTSEVTDPKMPFPVAVADCVLGPAGPGIATFHHYDANNGTPVDTAAVSGDMFLSFVDPTGAKPAKGSFSLDFGAQGMIHGDFSTYTCN